MYMKAQCRTTFPQYIRSEPSGKNSDGARLSAGPSGRELRVCSAQIPQYNKINHDVRVSNEEPAITFSYPSRSSDTRDLAEFLRTSCPGDFPKPLMKSSSEEQLFSFGSTYKKGFKFIRNSASKPKLNPNAPLPNNVRPKTTSWGKPYLHIQVDYDISYDHPHSDSNQSIQNPAASSTNESVNEIATDASPCQSCSKDTASHSPALCNSAESTKTLDAETMDTYQQYLNAEKDPNAFRHSSETETRPKSVLIEPIRGDKTKILSRKTSAVSQTPSAVSYKRRTKSQECSGSASYLEQSITPIDRRYSASERRNSKRHSGISVRSSLHSDRSDEAGDGADQRRHSHSRRAFPLPGPPPARGLPALPVVQKISNDRKSTPIIVARSRAYTTESCGSSISFSSIRYQAPDESDALQQLCKDRERRVRARKSRDLHRVRSIKMAKSGEGKEILTESCQPTETVNPEYVSSNRPIGLALYYPPDHENAPLQGFKSKSRILHGSLSPPLSPNTRTVTNFSAKKDASATSPSPSTIPSPATFRSPTILPVQSNNRSPCNQDMKMEMRIQAVEQKNKMLEQALVALIRGTLSQDQRQNELQKAKTLEDLLRGLKMVESPSSAAFFTMGNT